jgi:hypothetical protein
MDYLIGFIVGYSLKEMYKFIMYIASADTSIIAHDFDDEWDFLTQDDLP